MTIDEIYLSIAQNITDSIEDSWNDAVLNIEKPAEDTVKFKGGYNQNNNFNSFKFRNFDRRKLTEDCNNLYEITTKDKSNLWNRAKFTLEPTGKFSIDFEWDQTLADKIESLS